MFFIVAVMASNFLGDEETLVRFMNSKINDQSFNEVGFMLVAIVVTVGVLTTIASMVRNSSWQELLTREVLRELPRAIYAFGSSVSGPMIAAGVFISKHPNVKAPPLEAWAFVVAFFCLGAFAYGFAISYALNRKSFQ